MRKLKYIIVLLIMNTNVVFYFKNSIRAEENTNFITISADTTDWTVINEDAGDLSVLASNFVTINGEEYKIETGILDNSGYFYFNVGHSITNLATGEVINHMALMDGAQPTKLLVAQASEITYSEISSHENTIGFYKVESENGGEILKRMYLDVENGLDINIVTKVTTTGDITHQVEITNTSTDPLLNVSFMSAFDAFSITNSQENKLYVNKENSVYITDEKVRAFMEPISGIAKAYVGEQGISTINDLDNPSIVSKLELAAGSKIPDFINATIYFTSERKDVPTGETISFSYQEKIFLGEIKNDVVVKYLDSDNNVLSDIRVLSGAYGDRYETHKLNIEGYTYLKVEGDKNGIFSDSQQDIIYRYILDSSMNSTKITNNIDPLIVILTAVLIVFICMFLLKKKRNNTR